MKSETRKTRREREIRALTAAASLLPTIPNYVPEHAGQILISAAFLTESEVATIHGCTQQNVNDYKRRYKGVYLELVAKKNHILAAQSQAISLLAQDKIRQAMVANKIQAESVADLASLSIIAQRSARTAIDLEDHAPDEDVQGWSSVSDSAPTDLSPSTCSSPPDIDTDDQGADSPK